MMTIVEYEAIRAQATHFGVVPEHEQPEIERAIERHLRYFVVEKREQDAQQVARETAGRAGGSSQQGSRRNRRARGRGRRSIAGAWCFYLHGCCRRRGPQSDRAAQQRTRKRGLPLSRSL